MNFYISVVLMSSRDAFLDFQRLSRKSKKLKISMTADLRKIAIFANFSVLHILPQMSEFLHSVVLMSSRDAFLDFQSFPENQKNWRFRWPRTCEKLQFLLISVFCIFAPKWVNFYISVVLMSSRDAFLDFQRLSRKSKKLKISMTADLRKNCNFC